MLRFSSSQPSALLRNIFSVGRHVLPHMDFYRLSSVSFCCVSEHFQLAFLICAFILAERIALIFSFINLPLLLLSKLYIWESKSNKTQLRKLDTKLCAAKIFLSQKMEYFSFDPVIIIYKETWRFSHYNPAGKETRQPLFLANLNLQRVKISNFRVVTAIKALLCMRKSILFAIVEPKPRLWGEEGGIVGWVGKAIR